MESSQYFIAKSDKYVLVRKIGNRFFHLIRETSLDKGTQRKTTENELPSLTQCTA